MFGWMKERLVVGGFQLSTCFASLDRMFTKISVNFATPFNSQRVCVFRVFSDRSSEVSPVRCALRLGRSWNAFHWTKVGFTRPLGRRRLRHTAWPGPTTKGLTCSRNIIAVYYIAVYSAVQDKSSSPCLVGFAKPVCYQDIWTLQNYIVIYRQFNHVQPSGPHSPRNILKLFKLL